MAPRMGKHDTDTAPKDGVLTTPDKPQHIRPAPNLQYTKLKAPRMATPRNSTPRMVTPRTPTPRTATPRAERSNSPGLVKRVTTSHPLVISRATSPSPRSVRQVRLLPSDAWQLESQQTQPSSRDVLSASQKLLVTPLGSLVVRREESPLWQAEVSTNQRCRAAPSTSEFQPRLSGGSRGDSQGLRHDTSRTSPRPWASSPQMPNLGMRRCSDASTVTQYFLGSPRISRIERSVSSENRRRHLDFSTLSRSSLTPVRVASSASLRSSRDLRATSQDGQVEKDGLSASQRSLALHDAPKLEHSDTRVCQDVVSMSQRSLPPHDAPKLEGSSSQTDSVERLKSQPIRQTSQVECCQSSEDICQNELPIAGTACDTDPTERAPLPIESAPRPNLHLELKELRSILDMQYGQLAHLGAAMKPEVSAEAEQLATAQAQLLQKAASAAPDSEFREFCTMVACQQAKQETLFWMLSNTLDRLQQQVQILWVSTFEKQAEEEEPLNQAMHREGLQAAAHIAAGERESDAQTEVDQASDEDDIAIIQGPGNLRSGVDFSIGTLREAVDGELQQHAKAIKSLKTRVDDMSEFVEQALRSLNTLLSNAFPNGRPQHEALPHTSGEESQSEHAGGIHAIHAKDTDQRSQKPHANMSEQPSVKKPHAGIMGNLMPTIVEREHEADIDSSENRARQLQHYT